MVRTDYRSGLVLPGGVIEADESPAAAAEREVEEETGLVIAVTNLLVVEHLPANDAGPSGLRFVFDTKPVQPDPQLIPQPGEVTQLLWLHSDDAIAQHTQRGRRRLALALHAAANVTTHYLDHNRGPSHPAI